MVGEGEKFFEKDILIENLMAVLMVYVARAFYLTQSRNKGKKQKISLFSSLKSIENNTIRKSAKNPIDSSIFFSQIKDFDGFFWLYCELTKQHRMEFLSLKFGYGCNPIPF